MKPRMQYRSRRVQNVLFEPDHASMIVRNRQGRHYLIHGDDTRLITGFGDPLDAPATMGYGIYHDADRPNTLWIRDRTGLRPIQGVPPRRSNATRPGPGWRHASPTIPSPAHTHRRTA